MQVKFEDLKIGDEFIISSYSKLKYLKVVSITKSKNLKCSFHRNPNRGWLARTTLEQDISKHNDHIYLKNEGNWREYWLVKRN